MPVPGSRPPEDTGFKVHAEGWALVLFAAVVIIGVFFALSSCAPTSGGVPEAQAAEASLPSAISDVQVYNDPGGCQYLVFTNKGNSSTQVVVRQAPNTNGMCKAA